MRVVDVIWDGVDDLSCRVLIEKVADEGQDRMK
jgi:hypothetical protein